MELLQTIKNRIALVFPGQGSQYVGMGRLLYNVSPAARRIFDRADEVLGFSLTTLCFEGPQSELDDTMNAQPAILAVSIACLDALRERLNPLGLNVLPAMVAGHSLGEFTAMVAAGVLEFEEALLLVRERGRLMKESSIERPGGMAAVIGLNEQQLQEVVDESQSHGIVTMANSNSPGQTVLSGEVGALLWAMDLAKARGAKLVQRLAVSIASHSPLMQQAAVHFSELLSQVNMRPPIVPLIANISAQMLNSVEELRHELNGQLTRPVQWTNSVHTMVEHGVETFIELGPKQVLTGLIRRINNQVQTLSLSDVEIVKILYPSENDASASLTA
ncbi:MAG: ACP S-malonyltransferase [Chloroflexales bacterium]|nr:ACP S-malonyltransferase [Chloroflexales bacterium]